MSEQPKGPNVVIAVAENGFIARPQFGNDERYVFNSFNDLCAYLKDVYFPKTIDEKYNTQGLENQAGVQNKIRTSLKPGLGGL